MESISFETLLERRMETQHPNVSVSPETPQREATA